MADITNYKTLQAYVDATLAEDGSSKKESLPSTPATPATRSTRSTPSKPRKKKQTSQKGPR